ncbi:MAG: hypothetical protein ABI565_12755 [Vicinamibacteria bacterium]
MERERRKSAEALRLVAESAHEPDAVRSSEEVLGRPEPVTPSERPAPPPLPPWSPPAPPDLRPVNASWPAGAPPSSGTLSSLLGGSRDKDREAQVKFNSDQVQLDNALVSWTAEHFAATHRHFDALLGNMQRRMDDIDTRHRELERELVRHVHEMARRIDLVLGEGEKGRVSHEAALRSIRERLTQIEEKLS